MAWFDEAIYDTFYNLFSYFLDIIGRSEKTRRRNEHSATEKMLSETKRNQKKRRRRSTMRRIKFKVKKKEIKKIKQVDSTIHFNPNNTISFSIYEFECSSTKWTNNTVVRFISPFSAAAGHIIGTYRLMSAIGNVVGCIILIHTLWNRCSKKKKKKKTS